MAIMRWDPFRDVSTLQERINQLFESSFRGASDQSEAVATYSWKPVVDIYQTAKGIIIEADLPGMNKKDISLEIKDNVLTLRGERPVNADILEKDYYRQERPTGAFYREFTLQMPIDPQSVKAKFKDGVLRIELPNPKEESPKQVKVSIT